METRRFPEDPFRVDRVLGTGRSMVERVYRHDNPSMVFARKRFFIPEKPDPTQLGSIQNEISIMRRLRHSHIVEFRGSYICNNLFFVLLLPVADESLSSYFPRTQGLDPRSQDHALACKAMISWPSCLFRALDYVHSIRIRHKDIKPANILIKSGRVYLTDFGISNDFLNLTTSGTDGAAGACTWMYAAPEIDQDERRGRATDVWALGCVVMELCTVASGENMLEDFERHRRGGRSGYMASAYQASPFRLFDWMWLLMGSPGRDVQTGELIQKLLQLAFLMLDPDPQRRITTRQLVDLLHDPRCNDFHPVGDMACVGCRNTAGMSPQDIPLHSTFQRTSNGGVFKPSKEGLSIQTPNLWEEIKLRWLEKHIWWAEETWP